MNCKLWFLPNKRKEKQQQQSKAIVTHVTLAGKRLCVFTARRCTGVRSSEVQWQQLGHLRAICDTCNLRCPRQAPPILSPSHRSRSLTSPSPWVLHPPLLPLYCMGAVKLINAMWGWLIKTTYTTGAVKHLNVTSRLSNEWGRNLIKSPVKTRDRRVATSIGWTSVPSLTSSVITRHWFCVFPECSDKKMRCILSNEWVMALLCKGQE